MLRLQINFFLPPYLYFLTFTMGLHYFYCCLFLKVLCFYFYSWVHRDLAAVHGFLAAVRGLLSCHGAVGSPGSGALAQHSGHTDLLRSQHVGSPWTRD